MRKLAGVGTSLFVAVFMLWSWAGNLEPPGPPAPTMVTLQEIYDKLGTCSGAPSNVPKTGQIGCFSQAGTPVSCAGTGQDFEFQAGVSVDPRFTDNGDGTVSDNLTGLIWLQDANCFGNQDWTDALAMTNALADNSCGLTDGSAAGAWRLPNVREVHSLIDFGQNTPAIDAGHPFFGVQSFDYWSSTTRSFNQHTAWSVNLGFGFVGIDDKLAGNFVWPVRGGQ